jgi:hypothetical protein
VISSSEEEVTDLKLELTISGIGKVTQPILLRAMRRAGGRSQRPKNRTKISNSNSFLNSQPHNSGWRRVKTPTPGTRWCGIDLELTYSHTTLSLRHLNLCDGPLSSPHLRLHTNTRMALRVCQGRVLHHHLFKKLDELAEVESPIFVHVHLVQDLVDQLSGIR